MKGPVLVTGAAGFIGRALCQAFLSQGRTVYALDLKPPARSTGSAELLEPLWIQGDVCTAQTWQALPAFETLFHLAALTGVRPSLQAAPAYLRVNLEGTAWALDACLKRGVQEFLLASSSSVYGSSNGAPSKETDPLKPLSPYAVSKLAAETLVESYTRLYGLKAVALRFFTVYGPGQRKDMALYQFAQALLEQQPLTLFAPESTRRDMTYISDLINGMLKAEVWNAFQPAGSFAVFNLGSGQPIRLDDWVCQLESVSGLQAIEKRILPRPAGDASETWADLTHAAQLLSYTPTTSLHSGLNAFWNWFLRGNVYV